MKLVHPEIETHITFSENYFNSLIVENKVFFHSLIQDLYAQEGGHNGLFVLSDESEILDIGKTIELIQYHIPFEINTKSLLNKISATLEKVAMNETYYGKTMELISMVQNYLSELSFGFSSDIDFSKLSFSSITKASGFHVSDDSTTPLETLYNYMELVREFDKDKVFAFVNLKSYFSTNAIEMFAETALNHKFLFFLIDSIDVKNIKYEKKIIIDEDLCEI